MPSERMRIFHAIATLLEAHDFRDSGTCADFGKFEGEPLETIYFYEAMLDGDGESLYFGRDEVQIDLYDTTTEEREILGAPPNHTHFALEYSDTGFVSGKWLTEKEADKLRLEDESAMEEQEEEEE